MNHFFIFLTPKEKKNAETLFEKGKKDGNTVDDLATVSNYGNY
jgi:hypothetical protein